MVSSGAWLAVWSPPPLTCCETSSTSSMGSPTTSPPASSASWGNVFCQGRFIFNIVLIWGLSLLKIDANWKRYLVLLHSLLDFITQRFNSSRAAATNRCWLVRSRWHVMLLLHSLGASMVSSSTPTPSLVGRSFFDGFLPFLTHFTTF